MVDGVTVANEDIVVFDGSSFRRYFDGSDVGLAGLAIDAFDMLSPNELLLSFSSNGSVPGIAGTVVGADIVKFTAAQWNEFTMGSFTMYFDGSDVGLTKSSENIDAIDCLADGRLVISTTGTVSVNGTAGGGEDLMLFNPTSLGSNTKGTWSMYFDGSDVALSGTTEKLGALASDASGNLYLATSEFSRARSFGRQ